VSHTVSLDHFPMLAASGSIEAFISAANRVPMLSEIEEQALARRFRQDGDLDAARQLVTSHLRLVIAIARGYLGYGLPHADLIQEGNIGLMKAVKRFDPDRGVRLVSFAMHWIKAEIHEYILKNWRLVKIATTKAQRKLFFNLRSIKASLAQDADSRGDAARTGGGIWRIGRAHPADRSQGDAEDEEQPRRLIRRRPKKWATAARRLPIVFGAGRRPGRSPGAAPAAAAQMEMAPRQTGR